MITNIKAPYKFQKPETTVVNWKLFEKRFCDCSAGELELLWKDVVKGWQDGRLSRFVKSHNPAVAEHLSALAVPKQGNYVPVATQQLLANALFGEAGVLKNLDSLMQKLLLEEQEEVEKRRFHIGEDWIGKLPGGVELSMIAIPAGTFQMGYPSNQHKVTLTKPFWLGQFPVTQKQYHVITGKRLVDFPIGPAGFSLEDAQKIQCRLTPLLKINLENTPLRIWEGSFVPGHVLRDWRMRLNRLNNVIIELSLGALPAADVSWEDARKFCCRLNVVFSNMLPSGYHFDLPTEAQWEYACRAGKTDELSDSDLNDNVLYGKKWFHPVGTKKANDWGLYDMLGNVAEWCRDWYGPYPSCDCTDPLGPSEGESRILRGGSCNSDGSICCSCYRGYDKPTSGLSAGFRLAVVYKEDNT